MLKNASEVTTVQENIFFLKILNFVQSFVECKVSLADGNLIVGPASSRLRWSCIHFSAQLWHLAMLLTYPESQTEKHLNTCRQCDNFEPGRRLLVVLFVHTAKQLSVSTAQRHFVTFECVRDENISNLAVGSGVVKSCTLTAAGSPDLTVVRNVLVVDYWLACQQIISSDY